MLERQTPEREVVDPHSDRCVVSLSKVHLPSKSTQVIPRKRWLCPDMTEKLFTGTLSKNETKRNGEWVSTE